jgi:hypothetical protein
MPRAIQFRHPSHKSTQSHLFGIVYTIDQKSVMEKTPNWTVCAHQVAHAIDAPIRLGSNACKSLSHKWRSCKCRVLIQISGKWWNRRFPDIAHSVWKMLLCH